MAAAGQPTGYKPECIELTHNDCLLGATKEVPGDSCGVTLYSELDRHYPDFSDAVKRGRAVADPTVIRALIELRPQGVPHHALLEARSRRFYPPDARVSVLAALSSSTVDHLCDG
jgi:hypothetical protein